MCVVAAVAAVTLLSPSPSKFLSRNPREKRVRARLALQLCCCLLLLMMPPSRRRRRTYYTYTDTTGARARSLFGPFALVTRSVSLSLSRAHTPRRRLSITYMRFSMGARALAPERDSSRCLCLFEGSLSRARCALWCEYIFIYTRIGYIGIYIYIYIYLRPRLSAIL